MPRERIATIAIFIVLLTAVFAAKYRQMHVAAAPPQGPPPVYLLRGDDLRKALVANPELVKDKNPEGRTPLSLIFSYQKPSVKEVQMLLDAGADPRSADNRGSTVLHYAAGSATPEVLILLIKAGADVNASNNDGRTPLRQAIFSRKTENSDALVAAGARLDIFSAAALGKASELAHLIAGDPGAANSEDSDGYSAIDWAALRRQRDILKVIAKADPKVNIFRAAALGNERAVADALHTTPGQINSSDSHGLTPLDWASFAADLEMVRYLLEHGADPAHTHALDSAARYGDLEIAKLLVEHGGASSSSNEFGDPYKTAVGNHHPDIAEVIKQARK